MKKFLRFYFCQLLTVQKRAGWYILAAICWGFMVPEVTRGALIAEEHFNSPDYSEGLSLNSLNGGNDWAGAWEGALNGINIVPDSHTSKEARAAHLKVQIRSDKEDLAVFRTLKQTVGTEASTIWISFLIKKDAGNRWLGLSCFIGNKEKLFIGVPNGSDNLRLGTTAMTTTSSLQVHTAVVRIDFHGGHDTAYLFVDPSAASIPDIEEADAVYEGDLSFDRIRIAAGGGADGAGVMGRIGSILIGTQMSDVVQADPKMVDNFPLADDQLNVLSWEKRNGVLWVKTAGGVLKLEPYLDRVLQVQFGAYANIEQLHSEAVLDRRNAPDFDVEETKEVIELQAKCFSVQILKSTSQITILDATGKLLLQETPDGARSAVKGAAVEVADHFKLTTTEALYGLGEFRDKLLNLRNQRRELVQVNTQATVPVLLSLNGWGMFWDNPSRTVFNDDARGMSFKSDFGGAVSFYIFIGPTLDSIVQEYRQLTGAAPMPPRWALGYHQSRNRYGSQEEVLSIASRMRREKIPMDSIFIDYLYWGKYGVGSHHFDEAKFPDPAGMVRQLHSLNTKTIVSVWPSFKAGTANYVKFHKAGYLLDGAEALGGTIYDPFNPKAAALYWDQIRKNLLPLGIDGWFLDGCEPDSVGPFLATKTFEGAAEAVRNLYPLMHTTMFYNGLRAVHPNERVYIITRCGWASQQRNSTVVWSGDVPTTFDELQTQITAGLNFVAAGIPYWTTDIGGYSGGNPNDAAYRETYARWWEYGTFCPIFRSHGRRYSDEKNVNGPNELWAYGAKVQGICTQFGDLRYRLMPYIYSLSGQVTLHGYTPMRLLAFDFPGDTNVYNIKDQFMYGSALLINPVTRAGVTNREVYLPSESNWVDFWTGEKWHGGQKVLASAPIERIPIFVRAGSIIPYGPRLQYADEKQAAAIELRIYRGGDGNFELYEDDGQTFDYEKGRYTTIPFAWNQSSQTLTMGARKGGFRGMLRTRTFNIVWVSTSTGTGIQESKANVVVNYDGSAVTVHSPVAANN